MSVAIGERMHAPIESEVLESLDQRQTRVAEAVRIVSEVARMAGDQLPISTLDDVDSLTADQGVFILSGSENDPDSKITGASFGFIEDNLSGAADSAHAAIPGLLVLDREGKEESTPKVVAKCFTKREFGDRLERVKREVNTMRFLNANGALTIEPIAVVVANVGSEQEIVLLTNYYEALVTLDNLPWGLSLTPRNVKNAVLGASALGEFNAMGFKHGDAKVKNVAQDETGRMGMIDYETTVPIDVTDPADAAVTAYSDLGLYLDSLKGKGFFGSKDKSRPASEIREALDTMILSYTDHWSGATEEVKNAVWDGVNSAIDSVMPGIREQQGYYAV